MFNNNGGAISLTDFEVSRHLDDILQDFFPPASHSFNQKYPLTTILTLFKSTEVFNPILLKQLSKTFYKNKPENKEIFVTREELLQELTNPDISIYRKEDHKDVFDLLRGEKNEVLMSDILKNQGSLNSEALKAKDSFNQEDVLKLLGSMELKNSQ